MTPRLIDITGQRFGTLTVVERDMANTRPAKWICECHCGNLTSVRGQHLRDGLITTCADYTRHWHPASIGDLVGRRFGLLTVREKVGPSRWKCECDCGVWVFAQTGHLNNGIKIHCSRPHHRDYSESYAAVHRRIVSQRGPASEYCCVDCDIPGPWRGRGMQWSYDHLDPDELTTMMVATPGPVKYSTKIEHYQPRCRPCHYALDRQAKLTR